MPFFAFHYASPRDVISQLFPDVALTTTDTTKGLSVSRTNAEEVIEMLGGAESVVIVSLSVRSSARIPQLACQSLKA
jgi:hypothetical protein